MERNIRVVYYLRTGISIRNGVLDSIRSTCYIIVDHFCLAVRPSGRAAADNTLADGYPSFVPTINIHYPTPNAAAAAVMGM